MDLDVFEFDEIILNDAMVVNILVTYFDEGVFQTAWFNVGYLQSLCSDTELARVR